MTLSPGQEKALVLIQALVDLEPKLVAARVAMRDLDGDFSGTPTAIRDEIYGPLMAMLDDVLGDDDVASYFIGECMGMEDGGAVHETNGTMWPLRTVADLRAYLQRERGA